jgi:hypothetical protein
MRGSIFALSAAFIVALLTLFFGTLTAASAQQDDVALRASAAPDLERAGYAMFAFRAISVPFTIGGIEIDNDAVQVKVIADPKEEEGDAIFCPEDARIRVRVSVQQDSARAHSRGFVTGNEFRCPAEGGVNEFYVSVYPVGRSEFVEGAAEVCAMAIVYPQRPGAIVNQWCVDNASVEMK